MRWPLICAAVMAALWTAGPAGAQTRACSWTVVGSGTQANVMFPDQAATYWSSSQVIPQGGYVELRGWFPHARYTSLTTYTAQTQSIDGLRDTEIAPEAGSANPFVPGADRTLPIEHRRWTVRLVRGQVPATGREPNTIYTTSADGERSGGTATQRLSLRIYEGDRGRGPKGGVPLPEVTLVTADGARTRVAECPDSGLPDVGLNPTLAGSGSGEPSAATVSARGEDPPRWRKFTSLGGSLTDGATRDAGGEGGFGDNPDNKYVYTYFSQRFGQVLAFRAKAPTFPRTYDGQPSMGTGQLRYWSFCTNAQTTSFYGCRQDDQIPADDEGRYTVVISTAAARPRNATESCGVAWLPAGPLSTAVVILRNMLPDPLFAEAVQNTEPGTEAQVMGDYHPDGTYYETTAEFERLGCAGATQGGDR